MSEPQLQEGNGLSQSESSYSRQLGPEEIAPPPMGAYTSLWSTSSRVHRLSEDDSSSNEGPMTGALPPR